MISSPSPPTELHVITSGGFTAAFNQLSHLYTARTGIRVTTVLGPSMGETPYAIPSRLARREPADLVILARPALDRLAAQGTVVDGTQVDLGLSRIAVAVKAGAPLPDISTPEAFRKTLIDAKSVAWSDSASGVYLQTVLLKRLGIENQVLPKGRRIAATPVGTVVARGDAEIGLQQLSELRAISGIRVVGLIPESLQLVTPFSGGVVSYSTNKAGAQALLRYLSSRQAGATIVATGLQIPSRKRGR
jgi:molybdate transport system substrate-binding protein